MHGLYLLWWVQEKHLSPAAVASILAAGDLAIIALELPTGWFADRHGHRLSLILGSLAQVVGMLWCWLGQGVAGLVTASVLIAVGDAFRSGADQALLYRTCVVLDREDSFQKIRSTANAVELVALVVLILAGGVIVARWGFAAGWSTEIALCLLGLAISWTFVEPPPCADRTSESPMPAGDGRMTVKTMLVVIMPTALLGAAASAASFLAQTEKTSDPTTMTTLVAMIALAEAAGSAVAARVVAAGVRQQVVLAACGAGLAGVALAIPATFQLVVLALAFMLGLAHPLRDTAIQGLAQDCARARAASVASAVDMVFSTITLPLAGLWRSR